MSSGRRWRLRARTSAAALAGLLLGSALLADCASAHGISGQAALPVPAWLFAWAAAIALVVSFAALYTLWSSPQLQQRRVKRLLTLPRWGSPACGAVGLSLFGVVVYAGYAGVRS
jgi:hypothetical protein